MPVQPRHSRIVSSRFVVEEVPPQEIPKMRSASVSTPVRELPSRHPSVPLRRSVPRAIPPTHLHRPPSPDLRLPLFPVYEDEDNGKEERDFLERPTPLTTTGFYVLFLLAAIGLVFFRINLPIPFHLVVDTVSVPLWFKRETVPHSDFVYLKTKLEEQTRQLAAVELKVFHLVRDAIGRRDFASRLNGGDILTNLTSPSVDPVRNPPDYALDEDNRPGLCWLIGATSGQIGISLRAPTKISHITIDHVPKELSWEMGTAPNSIILWGIVDGDIPPSSSTLPGKTGLSRPPLHRDLPYIGLAQFHYDANQTDSHIQTFPVGQDIWAADMIFRSVVVEIVSNWGSGTTCLYRIRIHGEARVDGSSNSVADLL